MPDFRLVIHPPKGSAVETVSITAQDAREAFSLAQRYGYPAELWSEETHICTLDRSGDAGSMWVITPGHGKPKRLASIA